MTMPTSDRDLDAAVVIVKWCGGCRESLTRNQFGKNRRAPDGLNWRCLECSRAQSRRYIHGERGIATRRAYDDRTRERSAESKRRRRAEYAEANPQKVRARELVGNAVRRGYIDVPEQDRNWHNRWEFHHPDLSRPYYGVWVRLREHKMIHMGSTECPPSTDFVQQVRERLLSDWGLSCGTR